MQYLNEFLFVSRIDVYSLLKRANHMKVESHLALPPLASLSIPHTQYMYYRIIEYVCKYMVLYIKKHITFIHSFIGTKYFISINFIIKNKLSSYST